MIPSRIAVLQEFPLTPNGKIDTQKLLSLAPDENATGNFTTPTNELEMSLASAWEAVLEHKDFGIDDNFFRVGGDSLLVVKLKHELGKVFDTSINIVDLFTHTTIKAQAKLFMDASTSEEVLEIDELQF